MVKYDLTRAERASLAEFHREVQWYISTIANNELGCSARPEGIFRCEGGVRVNHRDIKIYKNYVMDVLYDSPNQTIEEMAVVNAINDLVVRFQKEGKQLFDGYIPQEHVILGNPLQAMLELELPPMIMSE